MSPIHAQSRATTVALSCGESPAISSLYLHTRERNETKRTTKRNENDHAAVGGAGADGDRVTTGGKGGNNGGREDRRFAAPPPARRQADRHRTDEARPRGARDRGA